MVAGIEVGIRLSEPFLSLDLLHLRNLPNILEKFSVGAGPRVLFLGNSMTREGLKLSTLTQEFSNPNSETMTFEKVHPDDTSICDWLFLYKHFVTEPGHAPDFLVISWAWGNLVDCPMDPMRLGAHYSNLADFPDVVFHVLHSNEARAKFILSHFLRSFAHRERVKNRVLDMVIPNYRTAARRFNETLNERSSSELKFQKLKYTQFEQLVKLAQTNGTKVILAAMPIRDGYEIDHELRRIANNIGVEFLDIRDIQGMTENSFQDEIHLNSQGADLYTRALAKQVRGVFSQYRAKEGMDQYQLSEGNSRRQSRNYKLD